MGIALESGQPNRAMSTNRLQVLQTAVPAIKHYAPKGKPSFLCSFEHRTEIVILRRSIHAFLVKPIVERQVGISLCP